MDCTICMEEAKDPVTFAPCQQCRMSVYCRECLAEFIKREEKPEAVRLQCPLCRRPVKKTRNFKPYGDAEAVRRLKAETGVSEKETIDARKRARAAELCTENGQVGRAWREAGEKRLEKRRREDNEEESERVAQALRQEEAARQQQVAEEEERQNEELLKRLLAEEAKADKEGGRTAVPLTAYAAEENAASAALAARLQEEEDAAAKRKADETMRSDAAMAAMLQKRYGQPMTATNAPGSRERAPFQNQGSNRGEWNSNSMVANSFSNFHTARRHLP